MNQDSQKKIFDNLSQEISTLTTRTYSTSFTMGIQMLDKKLHAPIYSIYGFVRLADEIVDSFYSYEQKELLDGFITDTWQAIDKGISLNPILNSFQAVVNKYNIDHECIKSFFRSMEMDLNKSCHDELSYKEYIWGSAEVVGLMCLSVFVDGNLEQYEKLKAHAISLGSAFQKVNFLRDLNFDNTELGRDYFPSIADSDFNEEHKLAIIKEIEKDFEHALIGIKSLPISSRFGVNSSYEYYRDLLNKLKKQPASQIKTQRIRISNLKKILLTISSYFKSKSFSKIATVFISFCLINPGFAYLTNAQLRESFEHCDESKQNAKDFLLKSTQKLDEDLESDIYQAYYASAIMLNSKYGYNPISKLKNFNQGRKNLENIVNDNPENIEIRYIRFATQYNTPFFLNYRDNLDQDYQFLIKNIESGKVTDENLENNIKRFIVEETGKRSMENF